MIKTTRKLNVGIHNDFTIEVVDITTGKVRQKAKAYNVVCNNYYNTVGNTSSVASYIQFGSGTGTPAATDTALFHYEGYAPTAVSSSFDTNRMYEGICIRTLGKRILNTDYVGKTITEIGLATSYSSGLVTHAMLQDMNGNPISIQHTDTDIINIYARIYLHVTDEWNKTLHPASGWHVGYSPGSFAAGLFQRILLGGDQDGDSGGQGLNYTVARAKLTNDIADTVTSNTQGLGSFNYDSSTKKWSGSYRIPAGDNNYSGGARFVVISGGYSYPYRANATIIMECTGPYSITSEAVGTGDGTTRKFKTKFGLPYNAKVYVNGVQVNNVTVTKTKCTSNSVDGNGEFFARCYPENGKTQAYYCYNGSSSWAPTGFLNYERTPYYLCGGAVRRVLYPEIGVHRITAPNGLIQGSNDFETWVDVPTSTSSSQMDQNYAHFKWYRNTAAKGTNNANIYLNSFDGYNIEFDAAPANGDVITIDYDTDCVPKTSDYVVDISIELQFGEYVGA